MSQDHRDANRKLLEDGEERARQRKLDEVEAVRRMGVEVEDIDRLASQIDGVVGALTVDLVATLFENQMDGRLKYNHTNKYWYHWDGSLWVKDGKKLVFEALRRFLRSTTNGQKAPALIKVRTPRFAKDVEEFSRSARPFAIIEDEWNADTMLLGTPTGVVDLRSGKIMQSRADQLINKQTLVTPGSRALCPRWLTFLYEACGDDPEMVTYLQRWCGYCLTGETREHALVFLHGPGGNGKSVFINVLSKLMGSYSKTAAMETFVQAQGTKHPTDLASIAGARLVVASEVEKGRSWDEQRIKSVTGGDTIAARFMAKDFFEYTPHFKLTIIGNHAPRLNNIDPATKRRFNIVPFVTEPKVKDQTLEQRLITEEGSEILRWMIEGCIEWQQMGLQPPSKVKGASDRYFRNQDILQQWIDDKCKVDPTKNETVELLYTSYDLFMKSTIGEQPLSKRAWGDLMEERGFERYRRNSERGHLGITMRNFLEQNN